jgi:hypothetical protein
MKMLLCTFAILGFVNISSAAETVPEKAEVVAKTATRSVNKGIHRTSEAVCGTLTGDNKLQCLAKKIKNRAQEGKDATVDKASEVKNVVDKDNK